MLILKQCLFSHAVEVLALNTKPRKENNVSTLFQINTLLNIAHTFTRKKKKFQLKKKRHDYTGLQMFKSQFRNKKNKELRQKLSTQNSVLYRRSAINEGEIKSLHKKTG